MSNPIQIDVWSDIACPWCYIGKRNLERGLAATAADDDPPVVEVVFHSYELSPETPADFAGGEADFLAEHKGVSRDRAEQMLAHVTGVAADAGLEYRFDRVKHTNTLKAHELLHFAREHGRQGELAERLMSAYFTEGRHVGRAEDLARLAEEVGLDRQLAQAALEDGRHADDVRADKDQARAFGIQGVPFFVIDQTYGVSGAQPAEAFAQILRQVWTQRREPVAPGE